MTAFQRILLSLALSLALSLSAVSAAGPPHAWRMTETGASPIGGTWTWDEASKGYSAKWDNGAVANLKMAKVEGSYFELTRSDPGGTSGGLTARYSGTRYGDTLKGTVVWNWRGKITQGTWEAKLAPAERYGPVLTPKQAGDMFDLMKFQTDVSFRYPADGCFARAHIMVRRMQSLGVSPQKVWAFANPDALYVQTGHSEKGFVTWGYHVAPTVKVRYSGGDRDMVIDPSLFSGPATVEQWQEAMHKPGTRAAFICRTELGQPPMQPSGRRTAGTGYWPSADPAIGLDAAARNEMIRDKPKER